MEVRHPVKFWILIALFLLILVAVAINLLRHPLRTNANDLVPSPSLVDAVEVWHSGKTVKLQSKTDIEQIYRLLDREVRRNLCPDNGFLWHSAGSPLESVRFIVGNKTYYLGVETDEISWNNYRYFGTSSETEFELLDDFILGKFK